MKYEIEVISPVHIGSGGKISPIEYVVADKFYRTDMDQLFEDKEFKIEIERFIEIAKSGALYLGDFSPTLAKEHVRYALDISESMKTNLQKLTRERRSIEVRGCIKTNDDAYIPGSTLKGSIRTAILWWVLKNDSELFGKVKRYLEILLNARTLSEHIENARTLEDIKIEIERIHHLKQNSDVYMNLLVEIAGEKVKKITKKVRDLSKIRREDVDDEIEKLVFGQDPTKDFLRSLQVSDTHAIPDARLKVEEIRTLTTLRNGRHGWEKFRTYVEALKRGTKRDLEMNIDKFLLDGDAARELHFESKQSLLREIPKICNEFADTSIVDEINFFKQYNTPSELGDILEFYERTRERKKEDSFLLRLAWGSGWHEMTVGRLLDPYLLIGLRKKFGGLGKNRVPEFPKTRRFVFENGKPKYPLGWVKLELKNE